MTTTTLKTKPANKATKTNKTDKTDKTNKIKKGLTKRVDTFHCCFCSRDVHTLLHQSTKEGTPYKTNQRKGQPTPLIYKTAKNEAICERCVGTYMVALANGGNAIIGFERGEGKYYTAHQHLVAVSQDILELDLYTHGIQI